MCPIEVWQILDVGSIWMKEFASALSAQTATVSWSPVFSMIGAIQTWQRPEHVGNPPLEVHRFPLQRGYARPLFRSLLPFEEKLLKRLIRQCRDPEQSALICSTPFYAPVAERWPGPVVYYATDLTVRYEGLNPKQVLELDRRLCRVARSVCPNSKRVAAYMVEQAGCSPEKVVVVPNATRASNLPSRPLTLPGVLPADLADVPRPIAGVIGNLAANMDWKLLAAAIRRTPYLSWVFVGPTSMAIRDRAQREARAWVMAHAHFCGSKPYGELQAYARCFDVAVLPYRKKEPTYSGSSTRFYEHLAACRPMIGTRGFAELLEKEPLIELVDTADEMSAALDRLRAADFADGLETARWQASLAGTWEERARTLMASIERPVSVT